MKDLPPALQEKLEAADEAIHNANRDMYTCIHKRELAKAAFVAVINEIEEWRESDD